ncbi:MAG: hypothetical protein HYZ42_08940 [Bacteroidetes bacterium]|nr:hypothetical protein [Bacteroidota bacterium]
MLKQVSASASVDTTLIVGYEYWFDRLNNRIYVDVNDSELVTLDEQINTSDLFVGIHALHIRFLDSKGKWSPTTNKFFVKTPQTTSGIKEIIGFEYWFDRSLQRIYVGQNNGNSIDIDSLVATSQLTNDIHSLHIRFVDNAGVWSSVYSKFFMKTPESNSGVKEVVAFEYWFDRQTIRIPVDVKFPMYGVRYIVSL